MSGDADYRHGMKNNFDFLVGEWTSTQRRLREVLNGCDEWDEFPGFTKC